MNDRNQILKILNLKTIAVVGMSDKKNRPSYYVSWYMHQNGYKIIPVNPFHSYIKGKKCYPELESIKVPIDIVNIFRKSEYAISIVAAAIKKKAKAIWMQDGVINKEAGELAKKEGLLLVMNDCILRQHRHHKAKLN